MHRGPLENLTRNKLAAVHLKVAARAKHTLDLQRCCILGECDWLQEEDAAQCRALDGWSSGATCHVRHLEIAGAREDDNALHDVFNNERAKRAERGRAEDRDNIC